MPMLRRRRLVAITMILATVIGSWSATEGRAAAAPALIESVSVTQVEGVTPSSVSPSRSSQPVVTELVPASGQPGQRIVIRGRHLDGVDVVTFGPNAATGLRRRSSTRVSVVVPRQPPPRGRVQVRVTTTRGTSRPAMFLYEDVVTQPVALTRAIVVGQRSTVLRWGVRDQVKELARAIVVRRSPGHVRPPTPSSGTPVARVDPHVTTFRDGGLQPDTDYSYSFFAVGGGLPDDPARLRVHTATEPVDRPGWTVQDTLDGVNARVMFDCPTTDFCLGVDAYGQYRLMRDGVWGRGLEVPEAHGGFVGVRCTTPRFCLAVDVIGASFVFDGERWAPPVMMSLLSGVGITLGQHAFDCASPTFCVAVDAQGLSHFYDGRGWVPGRLMTYLGGSLRPWIECVSTRFCMLAGTGTWTFDGTRWQRQRTPTGTSYVEGLTCPSTTMCRLLSGSVTSVWDGTHWRDGPPLERTAGSNQVEHPADLTCPTTRRCLATDGRGQLFALEAGTWVRTDTDLPVYTPSCPASGPCLGTLPPQLDPTERTVVLDPASLTTRAGPSYDRTLGIGALECPTVDFCMALDPSGHYWTRRDGSWALAGAFPIYADRDRLPRQVSCPSEDFCAAVGVVSSGLESRGVVSVYDGTSWSPLEYFGDPTMFSWAQSVSCASPTSCVAGVWAFTDSQFHQGFSTWDGSTWSRPEEVSLTSSRADQVGRVTSCAPDGSCASSFVGLDQDVRENLVTRSAEGTPWDRLGLGPARGIESISCVSARFCAAVGGDVAVYDGDSWAITTLPFTIDYFAEVSCAASDFCMAASTGRFTTWDGRGWTTAPLRSDDDTPGDVDCPDRNLCVLVTVNGEVQEYQPPSAGAPALPPSAPS